MSTVTATSAVSSLSKPEIIGQRKDDDLPCSECDKYGAILIIKVGDCTRDVCQDCVRRLGIEW
jgi:hypothetical protein